MTSQCTGWSGSGSCSGVSVDAQITVVSETSRVGVTTCHTILDSSLLEAPITFPGVLPAGMSATMTTELGDEITIEISSASVVENPLIKEKCSPCSCTTCLPAKICAKIVTFGDLYNDPVNLATTLDWDCLLKQWTGTAGDYSLTMSLRTDVCGADLVIDGPAGSYSGTYFFEGDLHPRKFHGTICKDSDGLEMTLGIPELKPCDSEPCDDPPPQPWVSLIDETVLLTDGTNTTGTVHLRDQSCGDCEACEGGGGGTPECCDPMPTQLFLQLIPTSGEAVCTAKTATLTTGGPSGESYNGTFTIGTDTWTCNLSCGGITHPGLWLGQFQLEPGSNAITIGALASEVDCPGVLLTGSGVFTDATGVFIGSYHCGYNWIIHS